LSVAISVTRSNSLGVFSNRTVSTCAEGESMSLRSGSVGLISVAIVVSKSDADVMGCS